MSGYDPQRQQQAGGCRDVLMLTRVGWGALMPLLLVGLGVVALGAGTFALVKVHWWLIRLPLGALAAVLFALVRRDRRLQREREREINRPDRPPPPPPGPTGAPR